MDRLEDQLNSYTDKNIIPMHMPGHKRNTGLVPMYLQNDITEIEGFDDLHRPSGILKKLEEDAASVWGAGAAVVSVNGATAPILAAVNAAACRGKMLIASNCHISVWHGLEISRSDLAVVNPERDPRLPFFVGIDPGKIRSVLESDPSIRTVVITSPTYEGVVSDTRAIYDSCKEHDAALIVDESHGAHFGLNGYFPGTSYADVVIKSIHKTLHAPTQTALLLSYSDRISLRLIRHYMDVFESSSPSYILMSGVSRVVCDLLGNPGITDPWAGALKECRRRLGTELKHLKLADVPVSDPSKIVILTGGAINGSELTSLLRARGVETEASFDTYIIAMTGIGDTAESLTAFADILTDIDRGLEGTADQSFELLYPEGGVDLAVPLYEAASSEDTEQLPADQCTGRVSASYVFRYPPGIPVLIPGQKITGNLLSLVPDGTLTVLKTSRQY